MIIHIPLKRLIFAVIALAAVVALTLTAAAIGERISSGQSANTVIIIDAGHGGFDGGAVAGDGTVEKDINLQLAKKLCQLFSSAGFETIMVRDEDTAYSPDGNDGDITKTADMKGRLALMNKYNKSVFISIHLNKYSTSGPKGAQVFYAPHVEEAMPLAEEIQLSIKNFVQPDNNRMIKKGTKDIYLLYNAQNPAVIVECGFLSNSEDLTNLKSEEYQKKMSFAIFCGFMNYYCGK